MYTGKAVKLIRKENRTTSLSWRTLYPDNNTPSSDFSIRSFKNSHSTLRYTYKALKECKDSGSFDNNKRKERKIFMIINLLTTLWYRCFRSVFKKNKRLIGNIEWVNIQRYWLTIFLNLSYLNKCKTRSGRFAVDWKYCGVWILIELEWRERKLSKSDDYRILIIVYNYEGK